LLASLVDGRLQYVGTVSKEIPEDLLTELIDRLAELKRNVPVVKCRASGIWVKPVVACKANFRSWSDNRTMIDPEFQELMAEVDYVE
jgi:ATP-dependent DNA ligase